MGVNAPGSAYLILITWAHIGPPDLDRTVTATLSRLALSRARLGESALVSSSMSKFTCYLVLEHSASIGLFGFQVVEDVSRMRVPRLANLAARVL
jgi:hypothetical protein